MELRTDLATQSKEAARMRTMAARMRTMAARMRTMAAPSGQAMAGMRRSFGAERAPRTILCVIAKHLNTLELPKILDRLAKHCSFARMNCSRRTRCLK